VGFLKAGILGRVAAGLLLALPISLLAFVDENHSHSVFVVDTWARDSGVVQLYFDQGSGWSEVESRRISVVGAECTDREIIRCERSALVFSLPYGQYIGFHIAFRVDPTIQRAQFFLLNPRVVTENGAVLQSYSAVSIVANKQISGLKLIDGGVLVSLQPGALDPGLDLVFRNTPLRLSIWSGISALRVLVTTLIVTSASIAIVFAYSTAVTRFQLQRRSTAWLGWPRVRLGLTVGVVAVSVCLSTYPVMFFGRSFTAPQFVGVPLVYSVPPYLPGGARNVPNEYVRYADVGAFPWQFRPWSVIESHAILDNGEFPLWNRYNSSGLPLLGQGNTQIVDPLNLLVVLGRGSAVAWDAKFLLAKTLFVIGNVLVTFLCVRSVPLSLMVGASSAFIGFFLFRINHGGFFTGCYAPWLLLAWILLATTGRRWLAVAAMLLFVVSTFGILGSGALKEGLAMALGIDVTGFVILISARAPAMLTMRRLTVLFLVSVATIMLTFPVWSSFLATLARSFSFSDAPAVHVLPLTMIGGLFDDMFYLQIALQRFPSLNLLLGLGILWAIVSFRRFAQERLYVSLLIGAALSALLVYGIIPRSIIAKIPFIANIDHVHDAFVGPVITIAIALAGYGFRAMTEFGDPRLWWRRHWIVSGVLVLLAASALLIPIDPARIGIGAPLPDLQDRWAWVFVTILVLAALSFAPLLRRVAKTSPRSSVGLAALILCALVLHVRNGMHIETGIEEVDTYTLNPGPRPDFSVPSPALVSLPNVESDPYRIVGLGTVLLPGYSGALGLEGINGPDPLVPPAYRNLLTVLHLTYEWGWRIQVLAADIAPLSGALDFLNVRYVAGMPGDAKALFPLSTVSREDLDIVERPTAWPRAYFTDDVRTYSDLTELAQFIQESGGKPFAALTAAEAAQVPQLIAPDHERHGAVPARDYHLGSNSTRFQVDAPGPGIIVLSEQFFDGFEAMVNGVKVPIFRINGIFKGIIVARAGTYDVDFTFNPSYWRLTPYIVSIGAIILLMALAAVYWVCVVRSAPTSKLATPIPEPSSGPPTPTTFSPVSNEASKG
jgi:hypothetical protein